MKRFLTLLLAVLIIIPLSTVTAGADGIYDIAVASRGAVMVNLDTDTVVYSKNENVRMYPASLTKLATALVVLTDCEDLDATATIPSQEVFADVYEEKGVNIALKTGEKIKVRDLLYGMILPSACDAASALAYYCSDGDMEAFYERMNTLAAEAGATDSSFKNAHGLHNDEHYSTPHDIAAILKKLLEFDEFRKIINTTVYTIPATEQSDERRVVYTIAMLMKSNSDYYEYMHGAKSGYTNQAGRCLASTAEKDGERYMLVLLGANLDDPANEKNLAYADTRALYDYAFENFERRELVVSGEKLTDIPVEGGETDSIALASDQSICSTVDKSDEISYEYNLPDSVEAPVGDGIIGTLTLRGMGGEIATVNLYPMDSVAAMADPVTDEEKTDVMEDMKSDGMLKILVIILAALFVFAVIFIMAARARNKKRRRKLPAKRYAKK